MILLAFRHGLRASELCSLRWEQVDLAHARLHVSRLKSGIPSLTPIFDPSQLNAVFNACRRDTALAPDRFKGFWKD